MQKVQMAERDKEDGKRDGRISLLSLPGEAALKGLLKTTPPEGSARTGKRRGCEDGSGR